jgi:hypothetical protein
MSVPATSRTRIVKRVSRWSKPGHGDARPDSYPSAFPQRNRPQKPILIAVKASPRATSARHHVTATLPRLASNVNTAIKSP